MTNLKGKTILITGGSGFIGSNLAPVLASFGAKIILFDNLSQSGLDNVSHLIFDKSVEFIRGDVRDYDVIAPLVIKSDYVFHLATCNIGTSTLYPRVDLETNIIGTFNVLSAARYNPKVRIIHASSGSVLGSSDKPSVEDSILRPTTPYAISKMAGEKYVKFFADEYGVKASIIRFFHVFGPYQDYGGRCGVINIFLSRILRNEPPVIWGSGEQIKCFTFVMDDIKAMMLLLEKDETIGQIYNVASETRITINDLAKLLIKKYAEDKDMKPIYGPAKLGENMNLNPDTTKIKNLGFKPAYDFEQALDITKAWVEEVL